MTFLQYSEIVLLGMSKPYCFFTRICTSFAVSFLFESSNSLLISIILISLFLGKRSFKGISCLFVRMILFNHNILLIDEGFVPISIASCFCGYAAIFLKSFVIKNFFCFFRVTSFNFPDNFFNFSIFFSFFQGA